MSHEDEQQKLEQTKKPRSKTPFRLWTMETLTAILVAVGFLTVTMDIIDQVYVIPTKQVQSAVLENFQEGRSTTFDNIRNAWTKMRVDYGPYIDECIKGSPSEAKLKAFGYQNDKNILQVKEVAGGSVLNHYWGSSVHEILDYELEWYTKYSKMCPPKNMLEGLNVVLHKREDKLTQLLLTKMYDPEKSDRYFNNPYFANF